MNEMTRIIKLIPLCLLCCGSAAVLTACSDFLEEYSQDTDYVRSWKDLDELLIGDCYWPVNATEQLCRAAPLASISLMSGSKRLMAGPGLCNTGT